MNATDDDCWNEHAVADRSNVDCGSGLVKMSAAAVRRKMRCGRMGR